MKRMLLDAMDQRQGLYWFEGAPFSGVGFELHDGGVVRSYEIKNGGIVAPYRSICAKNSEPVLQVDLSDQLSDYETPYFNGEPFNGLAFSFSGMFCDHEAFFENSVERSSAWWNRAGLMIEYSRSNDGIGELYEWHPNGALKYGDISTNSSFAGRIAFSEDGTLKYLRAERGFFNELGNIFSKTKFFPIDSRQAIGKLRGNPDIALSGDDIDDNLIKLLIDYGVLCGTTKLTILGTKIESLNLSLLSPMPSLTELRIEDVNLNKILLAQTVRCIRPDVRVLFNDIEV